MRRLLMAAAALLALSCGAANARTVTDDIDDFLPSYTGPHLADLDVSSFSVDYDAVASAFTLSATLAGDIDATAPGFYVIGVNTGTGPLHPFDAIGLNRVIFNQAIVIQKNGAAAIGGAALAAGASISGDTFSLVVPLSRLPTTGFTPGHYGFNLWPRLANNPPPQSSLDRLADFAPNNATLAAVPEPATWALMIGGFGLAGGALRRRRVGVVSA